MEKLYRKVGKRYKPAGLGSIPDISDGIWMVQTNPTSKRQTSLLWKVGELKRPVDVVTHASLQTMEEDIIKYISKLSDEESEEYKEAKEICGGFLRGPVGFSNISPADLATLFLRRVAINIENEKK